MPGTLAANTLLGSPGPAPDDSKKPTFPPTRGGAPPAASTSAAAPPAINPQSDCHLNRVYAGSQLRSRLEVIEAIRGDLQAENIEVPGVVVVGNQSAGKSSVGFGGQGNGVQN